MISISATSFSKLFLLYFRRGYPFICSIRSLNVFLRNAATRSTTSSFDSRTIKCLPLVRRIVVSGFSIIISIKSQLRMNSSPFNLLKGITDTTSCYRFRFTSSSRIESDTVMIRELAWKPLCVTIISENSVEMSTLDISSEDVFNAPVPSSPAWQALASLPGRTDFQR